MYGLGQLQKMEVHESCNGAKLKSPTVPNAAKKSLKCNNVLREGNMCKSSSLFLRKLLFNIPLFCGQNFFFFFILGKQLKQNSLFFQHSYLILAVNFVMEQFINKLDFMPLCTAVQRINGWTPKKMFLSSILTTTRRQVMLHVANTYLSLFHFLFYVSLYSNTY